MNRRGFLKGLGALVASAVALPKLFAGADKKPVTNNESFWSSQPSRFGDKGYKFEVMGSKSFYDNFEPIRTFRKLPGEMTFVDSQGNVFIYRDKKFVYQFRTFGEPQMGIQRKSYRYTTNEQAKVLEYKFHHD